jgi:hypothetical protein
MLPIEIRSESNISSQTEGGTRAPLGNKTTNAKARTGQVMGVKDMVKELEKTQGKPTTIRRQKQKDSELAPVRVEVLSDQNECHDELDIEYAPKNPKELPYESDVLPDGVLTFEGLKRQNLLKGYYDHFYDPVDDEGVRLKDKQFNKCLKAALEKSDRRIQEDIDEIDWSVSDVPESAAHFQKKSVPVTNPASALNRGTSRVAPKQPPTITARRAASALSMMSTNSTVGLKKNTQPLVAKRKPVKPINAQPLSVPSAVAEAASRSTLGYTKGRSASSILQRTGPVERARGTKMQAPGSSDRTARATTTLATSFEGEAVQRLQFLSIFEGEDEDDGIGRAVDFLDDSIDDGEFELKLNL